MGRGSRLRGRQDKGSIQKAREKLPPHRGGTWWVGDTLTVVPGLPALHPQSWPLLPEPSQEAFPEQGSSAGNQGPLLTPDPQELMSSPFPAPSCRRAWPALATVETSPGEAAPPSAMPRKPEAPPPTHCPCRTWFLSSLFFIISRPFPVRNPTHPSRPA